MAFDRQVSSITLTGSVLSSLATFCVLCCFVVFRKNQRTFRHALVLNLTLSDFINATTNVISGSIYIKNHHLVDSPACRANGWIEQFSVQATDFSILAISIATLLVVSQKARLTTFSTTKTVIICLSVWIMPLITSTTATAMGEMKPVSGNWCWISKERTDLRYGLTHGWRFLIIAITIAVYSYVWWYLSRHFKEMSSFSMPTPKSKKSKGQAASSRNYVQFDTHSVTDEEVALRAINSQTDAHASLGPFVTHTIEVRRENKADIHEDPKNEFGIGFGREPGIYPPTRAITGQSPWSMPPGNERHQPTSKPISGSEILQNKSRQTYKDIKRMLLLNGYPLLYVILWIPGIANRVIEATGRTASSRVLAILQCSTQFIGFANAITYGLNQQWRAGR